MPCQIENSNGPQKKDPRMGVRLFPGESTNAIESGIRNFSKDVSLINCYSILALWQKFFHIHENIFTIGIYF